MAQIRAGGSLVFEAFDKDLTSSDLLGETDPVDYIDIVADDRVHEFTLELFEKNGQRNGTIKVSTQLVFQKADPPVNPELNYNCNLQIHITEATFLKDTDTFGK